MIARIWRGTTRAEHADEYLAYLEATGLKDYAAVPGNQGTQVLRRIEGETAEFLILTLWDSFEAIRAFAGDDFHRAVYYPEDTVFLLELDPTVAHYEVIER